jgi:protein SCO1/2
MTTCTPGRRRRRSLIVLALVLGLIAAACGGDEEYVPAGIIRTPAPDVSGILLPDVTNDREVPAVGPEDGYLVLYFGFTFCPDVCPTTMSVLRRAMRDLGDDAERIDVAMITVDPDRDTPEVLSAYVKAFAPDGFAVRTLDADRLAAIAAPFGASYSVTVQEDGWVDVVHTGFLYAIDDEGILRLTWPFGIDSDSVHNDLRALLKEYDDA